CLLEDSYMRGLEIWVVKGIYNSVQDYYFVSNTVKNTRGEALNFVFADDPSGAQRIRNIVIRDNQFLNDAVTNFVPVAVNLQGHAGFGVWAENVTFANNTLQNNVSIGYVEGVRVWRNVRNAVITNNVAQGFH